MDQHLYIVLLEVIHATFKGDLRISSEMKHGGKKSFCNVLIEIKDVPFSREIQHASLTKKTGITSASTSKIKI